MIRNKCKSCKKKNLCPDYRYQSYISSLVPVQMSEYNILGCGTGKGVFGRVIFSKNSRPYYSRHSLEKKKSDIDHEEQEKPFWKTLSQKVVNRYYRK